MEYDVIRSDRRTFGIQIKNNRLIIRAPWRATEAEINQCIIDNKRWIDKHLEKAHQRESEAQQYPKLNFEEIQALAKQAMEVIPERVNHYAPLVGVKCGKITIRNQKTRWGSCSSKGNLNFNCLLMLTPSEVIDSVVVHELCHLKEMNHSGRFYAEVLRVYPNYWQAHKWLDEHGSVLLSRMID